MATAMSMTMFRVTLCQGIEKFETFLKIKKKLDIAANPTAEKRYLETNPRSKGFPEKRRYFQSVKINAEPFCAGTPETKIHCSLLTFVYGQPIF